MANEELMHHGILGMRWGVRRTPAQLGRVPAYKKTGGKLAKSVVKSGKKVPGKTSSSDTAPKKTVRDMTDEELRTKIARLQLEKQYVELSPKQISKGKEFVKELLTDIGKDVAKDMGKQVAKAVAAKVINEIADKEIVFANNKKKA